MRAMNSPAVKTRFAPSPTGLIHVGNVRTALFNALYARHGHGVFLLRIEDTDLERSRDEHTIALMEDLRWLGLDWQEGPAVGGEHGPYAQSQRDEIYQRYFALLEDEGLAYPCFCSQRELDLSRKTQLASGRPPRYAGTCARLNPEERQKRLDKGIQPTLRFRVLDGDVVRFEDLVRGPQSFATDDIGDFVIRRSEGNSAAFFFSNAIDDALMGVTHVLRGEDHLTNTPRQILLQRALSLPTPHYGHISMIVGSDGTPLSKRSGSRSVRELREIGYLPLAVVNYLARLGHHYENNAYMAWDELAKDFDLPKLGRSPARYDGAQLDYYQRQAVQHADSKTLWQWMGEAVHALVPAAQRDDFVAAVRGNIMLPGEALHWARVLFAATLALQGEAQAVVTQAGPDFFAAAAAAHAAHPADYAAMVERLKRDSGAKGKNLFKPLRAALTGELDGPELAPLLTLMGAERARARLARWI